MAAVYFVLYERIRVQFPARASLSFCFWIYFVNDISFEGSEKFGTMYLRDRKGRILKRVIIQSARLKLEGVLDCFRWNDKNEEWSMPQAYNENFLRNIVQTDIADDAIIS